MGLFWFLGLFSSFMFSIKKLQTRLTLAYVPANSCHMCSRVQPSFSSPEGKILPLERCHIDQLLVQQLLSFYPNCYCCYSRVNISNRSVQNGDVIDQVTTAPQLPGTFPGC